MSFVSANITCPVNSVNLTFEPPCAASPPGGAINPETGRSPEVGRSPTVLGGSGAKTANAIGLLPYADDLLRNPQASVRHSERSEESLLRRGFIRQQPLAQPDTFHRVDNPIVGPYVLADLFIDGSATNDDGNIGQFGD